MKLNQNKAPVYEALQEYRENRIVSFDVPGHKQGKGNPELTEFLGKQCMSVDVNSMKPLDNLCHPVSVIKEAEELMDELKRVTMEAVQSCEEARIADWGTIKSKVKSFLISTIFGWGFGEDDWDAVDVEAGLGGLGICGGH